MKKRISILLILMVVLLFTSGCGCGVTTITEEKGDHIYSKNDDIQIIDIDTRDNVGTLTLTGVKVLKNKPFTIKEEKTTDENDEPVYVDVKYSQLIQVFYKYNPKKGSKNISHLNFHVYDSEYNLSWTDPDIDYDAEEREGQSYFVAPLKAKSDSVLVHFYYNVLQLNETAKIKMKVPKKSK